MLQSQILTFGVEGSLAERLRELARTHRVWLRETSQLSACQRVLHASLPNIFVLRLGREIARELTLLEQTHASLPGTAVIVIGEADNSVLMGLAWELGATFALFPPMPTERITEIIVPLLPKESV